MKNLILILAVFTLSSCGKNSNQTSSGIDHTNSTLIAAFNSDSYSLKGVKYSIANYEGSIWQSNTEQGKYQIVEVVNQCSVIHDIQTYAQLSTGNTFVIADTMTYMPADCSSSTTMTDSNGNTLNFSIAPTDLGLHGYMFDINTAELSLASNSLFNTDTIVIGLTEQGK